MAYTWIIENVDYNFDVNGFTNVITNAQWRYVKEETIANTVYRAESFGSTVLSTSYLDANTFVSWENLTQNTIVEWITSTMGNTAIKTMEDSLTSNINLQANPVSASGLPWPAPDLT